MNCCNRASQRSTLGAIIGLFTLLAAVSVWAAQRPLKSKTYNHQSTPVVIKQSKAVLVETFSSPTQLAAADVAAKRSTIRYANRAGMMPSSFEIQGEILCYNQAPQPIEALSLMVVPLDPFHQPIQTGGQSVASSAEQIVIQLPSRGSKPITWHHSVRTGDVFEVAIIVTRVRFRDGSVWMAPGEELIDIF